MTPNPRWFPSSLQERAAWYQNFIAQFNTIGVDLGIIPAELITLTNDATVMEQLAETTTLVDNFAKAVRQFRLYITEGNVGDPNPEFPTLATLSVTGTPTGMFERLDAVVKRIRVSPNYTPEIGALLGIIPESPVRPAPDQLQPTLKLMSMPGSVVQVKFARNGTEGVMLETKIDNADTWSEAGKFYSSPAQLVIPNNPQNLPRSVQVRARYVEGNQPVGQLSPVVSTATQPTV